MRLSTFFLCLLGTTSSVFAKPVGIRKREMVYEYTTTTEWETVRQTLMHTIKTDKIITKTATTIVVTTISPSATSTPKPVTVIATKTSTIAPSSTGELPKLRPRWSGVDDEKWHAEMWGDEVAKAELVEDTESLGTKEVEDERSWEDEPVEGDLQDIWEEEEAEMTTTTATMVDYSTQVNTVTKATTAYTSTKVKTAMITSVSTTTLKATPKLASTATSWTTLLATPFPPSVVLPVESPSSTTSKPLTAPQKAGIAVAAMVAIGAVGGVAVCYIMRRAQRRPPKAVVKDSRSAISISSPRVISMAQTIETPSSAYLGIAQSLPFRQASLQESRPNSAEGSSYSCPPQHSPEQRPVVAAAAAVPLNRRESFVTVIEDPSPVSDPISSRRNSDSATIRGIIHELPTGPTRSLSTSTTSTTRAPPPPAIQIPARQSLHPDSLTPGLRTSSPSPTNNRLSIHPDSLTPGSAPSPYRHSTSARRPRSAVSPVFSQPAYTLITRKSAPAPVDNRASSVYEPYRPESQQSWAAGDDSS